METVTDWGDAIFLSITNALNTFLAAIPQIIGALLILLIGWIIAGIVARLLREVLERAGVDRLFAKHGGEVYGIAVRRVPAERRRLGDRRSGSSASSSSWPRPTSSA